MGKKTASIKNSFTKGNATVNNFIRKYKLEILQGGGGDPSSRAIMKELTVDKYIRENLMEQDMLNKNIIIGDRSKYFKDL